MDIHRYLLLLVEYMYYLINPDSYAFFDAKNVIKVAGDNHTIECRGITYDVSEVILSVNGTQIKKANAFFSYTLYNLIPSDTGLYRCMFVPDKSNKYSKTIISHNLTVFEFPPFKNNSMNEIIYVKERGEGNIDCELDFPTIEKFKNKYTYEVQNEMGNDVSNGLKTYKFASNSIGEKTVFYCNLYTVKPFLVKRLPVHVRKYRQFKAPTIEYVNSIASGSFEVKWLPPYEVRTEVSCEIKCVNDGGVSKVATLTQFDTPHVCSDFSVGDDVSCQLYCNYGNVSSESAKFSIKLIDAKISVASLVVAENEFLLNVTEDVFQSVFSGDDGDQLTLKVVSTKTKKLQNYTLNVNQPVAVTLPNSGELYHFQLYLGPNSLVGQMYLFKPTKEEIKVYAVKEPVVTGTSVKIEFLPLFSSFETNCHVEVYSAEKSGTRNSGNSYVGQDVAYKNPNDPYFTLFLDGLKESTFYKIVLYFKFGTTSYFIKDVYHVFFVTENKLLLPPLNPVIRKKRGYMELSWTYPSGMKEELLTAVIHLKSPNYSLRVFEPDFTERSFVSFRFGSKYTADLTYYNKNSRSPTVSFEVQ